jgi:hypothetical protein
VSGRPRTRVLIGLGVVAATLAMATAVSAAGEVVVSASPAEVRVGQPVEILVRTFVPIQREGTLAVAAPREPYPAPSGHYDVLYPWDDYPFDVVAEHAAGTALSVDVSRDRSDSTLWRGSVVLPTAGTWTVWVRNFQHREPGSTTVVEVKSGPPGDVAPASTTSTTASGSVDAGPAAVIGALVGLLLSLVIAPRLTRRPPA